MCEYVIANIFRYDSGTPWAISIKFDTLKKREKIHEIAKKITPTFLPLKENFLYFF